MYPLCDALLCVQQAAQSGARTIELPSSSSIICYPIPRWSPALFITKCPALQRQNNVQAIRGDHVCFVFRSRNNSPGWEAILCDLREIEKKMERENVIILLLENFCWKNAPAIDRKNDTHSVRRSPPWNPLFCRLIAKYWRQAIPTSSIAARAILYALCEGGE